MTTTRKTVAEYYDKDLAKLLAEKIRLVYPEFAKPAFIKNTADAVINKSYSERMELFAISLQKYLPADYQAAINILLQIIGPENPNETGMFKEYYWVMPIAKFVEMYGIDDFKTSMKALAEITKRSTGEFAVRPFIRKYPDKSLKIMHGWTSSPNFHLRRLASEGLRPKLPWASKLDTFTANPQPVFAILELLKTDEVKFVQKSVANNLRDYLKVNKPAAQKLLQKWSQSKHPSTVWIVKHATRKNIVENI